MIADLMFEFRPDFKELNRGGWVDYFDVTGTTLIVRMNSACLIASQSGFSTFNQFLIERLALPDSASVTDILAAIDKLKTIPSLTAIKTVTDKMKGTIDLPTITIIDTNDIEKISHIWGLIERILKVSKRSLLWGPPGTGKTFCGTHSGLKPDQRIYNTYMTPETPAAELRGFFHPVPEGNSTKFEWNDGPVVAAWRYGGRLVINEINLASNDCMSLLLNILDDAGSAQMVLPTKEVLSPHPDFTVVATMNGNPEELMPALRDRFPVTLEVKEVHPMALQSLPEDIRQVAAGTASSTDPDRRVSIRVWAAFAELRDLGANIEDAAEACFGKRGKELVSAMRLAEAK